MAKVPFSKLQANINMSSSIIEYKNKSGDEIKYEVKYYLPFKEKLELVSRVINQSIDENGFYNPMRVQLYTTLEVVYAYTNLSFTEKMKEDPFKLYDMLTSNGIFENIIAAISQNDWVEIQENIQVTIKNIYDYKNSLMGIMEAASADYSQLNLDALEIKNNLADKDNLNLLRDVLSKLG